MIIKKTITYANFSTADVDQQYLLYEIPAKAVLEWIKIKHSTAFSGGSITSYVIEAGIAGDTDKYMKAFDVFQAVATAARKFSFCACDESNDGAVNLYLNAIASHNLDTATAGVADVWIKIKKMV